MSAQTQTHKAMHTATIVMSLDGYARRVRAAQRRADDARRLARLYPTTHNEERAAELEAGLARIEAEAQA